MSTLTKISPLSHFDEVESNLSSMGLTKMVFEDAINAGLFHFKRVTPLHPLSTAGSRFWEEVVAALRHGLTTNTQTKWGYKHLDGLSLTYCKEHQISIVVTSGNKYAGLSDGRVKTKNAKGPSTIAYVCQNQDLFRCSDDVVSLEDFKQKTDSTETWVYLYHIDKQNKVVRAELSLPKEIHQIEGKLTIDEWEKRIILPVVSYDASIEDTLIDQIQDFSPEIDFSILM
jgi:hypothetical protein